MSLRPNTIAIRPTKIILCRSREGQTISQPYIVALHAGSSGALAARQSAGGWHWVGLRDRVAGRTGGAGYFRGAPRRSGRSGAQRCSPAWVTPTSESWWATALRDLPQFAPYDAIIVSAAARRGADRALLAQLAEGGRMIIPSGHGRFPAAAIHPHRKWPATNHAARTLPVRSADLGRVNAR